MIKPHTSLQTQPVYDGMAKNTPYNEADGDLERIEAVNYTTARRQSIETTGKMRRVDGEGKFDNVALGSCNRGRFVVAATVNVADGENAVLIQPQRME